MVIAMAIFAGLSAQIQPVRLALGKTAVYAYVNVIHPEDTH